MTDRLLPPRRKVAELWSVEKPSFRPGSLKIFVKIPNSFFHIFNVPRALFFFAPLTFVPCGIVFTAHLTFTAESMTGVQGKHLNIGEEELLTHMWHVLPWMRSPSSVCILKFDSLKGNRATQTLSSYHLMLHLLSKYSHKEEKLLLKSNQ